MKYIDADLLRKEIDKWVEAMADAVGDYSDGVRFALEHFTFVLDSLQQEQPEVDLEKALNSLDDAYFDLGGIAVIGATYYLTVEDLKDIASHFYELGKNSK